MRVYLPHRQTGLPCQQDKAQPQRSIACRGADRVNGFGRENLEFSLRV